MSRPKPRSKLALEILFGPRLPKEHERELTMAKVAIRLAEFDYSTPLVLELNEITVLMGVSAIGIITVMSLCLVAVATSVFSKNAQGISEDHYSRD